MISTKRYPTTSDQPLRDSDGHWPALLRYYESCVRLEDALTQRIELGGRKKDGAPEFVAPSSSVEHLITDSQPLPLDQLVPTWQKLRPTKSEHEVFFGYPCLVIQPVSEDDERPKPRVLLPALVLPVEFDEHERVLRCNEGVRPSLHPLLAALLDIDPVQEQILDAQFSDGWGYGERSMQLTRLTELLDLLGLTRTDSIDPSLLRTQFDPQRAGVGAVNATLLYRTETTPANRRLLFELSRLRTPEMLSRLDGTALTTLGSRAKRPRVFADSMMLTPLQSNEAQDAAALEVLHQRLTVLTGPPGTGKTQFVSNLTQTLAAAGQTVLITSTNNEAVNEAAHRLRTETGDEHVIRTGATTARVGEAESEQAKSLRQLDELIAMKATNHEVRLDDLVTARRVFTKAIVQFDRNARRATRLTRLARNKSFFSRITFWWLTRFSFTDSFDEMTDGVVAARERVESTSLVASHDMLVNRVTLGRDAIRTFKRQLGQGTARDKAQRFAAMLRHVPAWATTTQSPSYIPLEAGLFDVVVIDEASQCPIANTLPWLYRAKRVVVIGDQEQLPYVTGIDGALDRTLRRFSGVETDWFSKRHLGHSAYSVFAAAQRAFGEPLLLNEHYRCAPSIIGPANEELYEGRLSVLTPRKEPLPPENACTRWIDVKGLCERRGGSTFNSREAIAVAEAVAKCLPELGGDECAGVVTPLRAQSSAIRRELAKRGVPRKAVRIGTAHTFQGGQADVIFLSPVVGASAAGGTANWLQTEPNLLNVAISRAKRQLFIVGDRAYWDAQPPGLLSRFAKPHNSTDVVERTEAEQSLAAAFEAKGCRVTSREFEDGRVARLVVETAGRTIALLCLEPQRVRGLNIGQDFRQQIMRHRCLREYGLIPVVVAAWEAFTRPSNVVVRLLEAK